MFIDGRVKQLPSSAGMIPHRGSDTDREGNTVQAVSVKGEACSVCMPCGRQERVQFSVK